MGLKEAFKNARYAIEPDAQGGRRAEKDVQRFSVKFAGAESIIQAGKSAPAQLHLAGYGWGSELRPTAGAVTQVESTDAASGTILGTELYAGFP